MAAQSTIVFDFDGTLADTWRDIETALNRTLGEAGLSPVSGPDVRAWIGDGALKLLEHALAASERAHEPLEEWYERFRVHYDACCLDTTELYPGVSHCLEDLSDHRLAILSNKPGRFLDRIVDGLGLKGCFEVALGGDALDVRKPDPRTLLHVVEAVGGANGPVWMIGDSAIDVNTGLAARARTIGCAWGLRGREELREAGPEFLLERADEIAPVVLGRR